MCGQIVVVQMAVRVLGRRLADYDTAINTVEFLETSMSVPEVSTSITFPLVSETSVVKTLLQKNWRSILNDRKC